MNYSAEQWGRVQYNWAIGPHTTFTSLVNDIRHLIEKKQQIAVLGKKEQFAYNNSKLLFFFNAPKGPCKIQCTFYCQHVERKKYFTSFCLCWTPTLRLKITARTKLSDGVGCKFWFCDFHQENVVFVLEK